MSRVLSLSLAAALVASTALTAVPASAGGAGFSVRSGEWGNDHWRGGWDGDRRWGRRHHHNQFAPGFSFSFGVPFPPVQAYYRPRSRDCYREWDGTVYCRTY